MSHNSPKMNSSQCFGSGIARFGNCKLLPNGRGRAQCAPLERAEAGCGLLLEIGRVRNIACCDHDGLQPMMIDNMGVNKSAEVKNVSSSD